MDAQHITRRSFLYGSALAAGAVALSACGGGGSDNEDETTEVEGKGSASRPLPPPDKLNESPLVADMVKSGDLPKLEERLPETPYVVPHNWLKPGKYGGTLNMNTFSTTGMVKAESDREFFYGHSPLRFLNDGLDVGPGLVETWDSNEDASEWTLYFRKGLKWSDGEPWTTQDILFWWEEFILGEKMAQTPPDECRSGKGTLAKMEAVDDSTLKMTFDAPAPLTADRLAMWVNGNIGKNGPIWMMPRHYLEQFHPKYGKNVPAEWDSVGGLMEQKADWHRNPECPTMTGFRCKSFDNNKGVTLERNPFYYAVNKNGDQLPYLDEVNITLISDPEAGKLQVQQGDVDYSHGGFNQIALNDVKGIRDASEGAGTEVILWDSGSGTGSIFFLNYDYVEDDLRELIREPKFRQAISLAFNRKAVQQGVYFNTGELTTGTLSPKAMEYLVNDEGKQVYKDWRDSYVDYDKDRAMSLLDEIGVKDTDGDGMRELPSGKKLTLRLDYPADESQEHKSKDEQLRSDLEAVGIKMIQNPVPPQAFDDRWKTGTLMGHSNWEVGDGPNHLLYPQWLVPLEYTRWAPLEGQWYQQRGTQKEGAELDKDPWDRDPPRMEPEKGGPIARMWEIYDQSKIEPDQMKRTQLVWDMIKIHIEDGPFYMGCVANYPQVVVVKTDLGNVPRQDNLQLGGLYNPWIHPTPAVYDPEAYFWQNPEDHA